MTLSSMRIKSKNKLRLHEPSPRQHKEFASWMHYFAGEGWGEGSYQRTNVSFNPHRSLANTYSVGVLIRHIIEKPQRLIDLLSSSSTADLEALQRLGLSTNWQLLIALFLRKNDNTSVPYRRELINFLRDFAWLTELKACSQKEQMSLTQALKKDLVNLSYCSPLSLNLRIKALYQMYGLAHVTALLGQLSDYEIFTLWATIADKDEAHAFFQHLLLNERCRKLLGSGTYARQLRLFLQQQRPAQVVADYLTKFHQESWFLEGLALFTAQHWLREALALLSAAQLAAVFCSLMTSWDGQSAPGFKLFGLLLFYCSTAGQTQIFFNKKGHLNPRAVNLIPPQVLSRLVGDFAVNIEHQQHLNKLFQAKDLAVKNISVLGMYLLHYSGATSPLIRLLGQYFSAYAGKAALIYPLSAFLVDFAERAVSGVLFDSLQQVMITRPQVLDRTLFAHLASYYVYQQQLIGENELEAQIHLLSAWGQMGAYQLVNRATQLLLAHCSDETLKPRLIKAELESRIEAKLQALHAEPSLYNNTLKWWQRLWHYGLQWSSTRSQLLVYADEGAFTPLPCFAETQIASPTWQAKEVLAEELSDTQSLIRLLSEVVRSAANTPESAFLGKIKQTLFAPLSSPTHILPELASKQLGAHV